MTRPSGRDGSAGVASPPLQPPGGPFCSIHRNVGSFLAGLFLVGSDLNHRCRTPERGRAGCGERRKPCYSGGVPAASQLESTKIRRHSGVVRATHWLTFIAFIALLITGGELIISHPRFYWGEVGNVNTKPAFVIPIPSSRGTGADWISLRDAGSEWMEPLSAFRSRVGLVLTGLVYGIYGVVSGHFWKDLLPERRDWNWRAFRDRIVQYLHASRRIVPGRLLV